MERKQIIEAVKQYFDIRDLVCRHTYEKFGNVSWQFLDTELLETILIVRRDVLEVPMIANNWRNGGSFTQRGLRCNLCQLVREKTAKNLIYLSAHTNGAGLDFDAKGLTAEQARQKIIEKQALLPYPIRLEKNVTWVHLDIYDLCNDKTVNLF